MADPFIAEIRIFGFNFPPRGFAHCNGQLLPINQNQALFSLLGTTYGGNGQTNFGLPDLRGRTPLHSDSNFPLGSRAGEEAHTLNVNEIPAHSHEMRASTGSATTGEPDSSVVFAKSTAPVYHAPTSPVPAAAGTVSNAGGGQPHDNMQPSITLNFCIALQGLFPSRN